MPPLSQRSADRREKRQGRPNLLFEFHASWDHLARRYGASVATTYFCLRRRGVPAHLCLLAAREQWERLGAHGFDFALIGSLRSRYRAEYPLWCADTEAKTDRGGA